jgi:hypothetical protein
MCAECWVEMHNGHEPISLEKRIEMERQNSLAEFKQLKKELEKIVSDYEESSRSVSNMFSVIKQVGLCWFQMLKIVECSQGRMSPRYTWFKAQWAHV